MWPYQRFIIADHERGILSRDRSIVGILEPGIHRFWNIFSRHEVKIYDLGQPEFRHPREDFLLKHHAELCDRHFYKVELNRHQVGLVYKNEHLQDILPPDSRWLYWKGPVDIRVEVLDIDEDFRLEKTLAGQLTHVRSDSPLSRAAREAVHGFEIPDQHVGLLIVDGEIRETLPPGLHAFWRFQRHIEVEHLDLRVQVMEVQGQEILSRDKVSLRANLTANYRITDPVTARRELGQIEAYLYRVLQFGLRQAISDRNLDELLGNKDGVDQAASGYVSGEIEPYGLELVNLGVKDIILPGEMKEILNQVVQAEKAAQANVIRRREETAATRSLLNTAKLMDENPTLLRLKELEMLEKVTEKIGSFTVFGGLDGVLKDMVKIPFYPVSHTDSGEK